MAPKNFEELDRMLDFAINKVRGPVAIRYPRGSEDNIDFYKLLDNNNGNNKDLKKNTFNKKKIIYGRAEVLAEGNDLTIIAIGKMVSKAVEVADKLKNEYSINAKVINSRFLKPFDKYTLINDTNKKIYTIEDGSIIGGLYSSICEMNESLKLGKAIKGFAYADRFIKHGSVE
jgi:1-deoxy-D-xylulose-5-phosphate synthase